MSGLSGHMMHPHEDIKMTLCKYKKIAKIAMGEKLSVTIKEKVDGFGFQFCIDNNQIKLVRSKGDLENHGVALENIDERMAHNPEAAKLYKMAIAMVGDTFNKYPELWQTTHQWPSTYNCEIIQPGVTNLIEYNRGWKVYIHNCWHRFRVESEALVTTRGLEFEVLENTFSTCNTGTTPKLKLNEYTPLVQTIVLDKLDKIFGKNTTVKDVYINRVCTWLFDINNLNWDGVCALDVAMDLVNYIFKDNPKNLRELKSKYGDKFITKERLREIYEFATEELDEFDLMLGELAIESITPAIEKNARCEVVDKINEAFNRDLIDTPTYNRGMERWNKCGWRIHSIEGITINDRWKLTGSFGPLNQLVGKIKRNM